MKKMTQVVGKVVLGCVIALCLVSTVHAQIPPFPDPGDPGDPPTAEELEAQRQAWLAGLSNNLVSVSFWLHDGLTNQDGSAVESFQALIDAQTMAFSGSDTFNWQSSALDEALTWATAVGMPTVIVGGDGPNAYLVSREDGVPNYICNFDMAAAVTINTTNLWPGGSTGFNLTGTNTVISQWDEASPRLSHSEFGSRVTELDGVSALSDHSTAVAGILSAAGANTIFSNGVPIGPAAKGMSFQAQIQARDFFNDAAEMTGAVGTNHTRLSNHSYGAVAGWYHPSGNTYYWLGYPQIGTQDPRFGNYTTNASAYDIIAQNAPTYLQVWAAGNDQGEAPPTQPTNHFEFTLAGAQFTTNAVRAADGDQGGYDTISQQGCAKDILTVGAVNPLPSGYSGASNLVLGSFSSCGPTDDGRIKPDVVADGVNNIVTLSGSDFAYGQGSGTSFAAPSVAGSIDLLTQFYKQVHPNSAEPLASTIKGLVIHTADSGTTNNGPSYRFGWGLMNAKTAAGLINQDSTNGLRNQIKEALLPNGQFIQFPIVSAGTNALKVTICWTDPAGLPNVFTNLNNATPRLVNDLDLRIISPSGTTNLPWVLNPDLTNRTAAARAAVATTGDDARNNVEQVYIPSPASGTYTVKVSHKGTISGGSQWVSILVSGNVPQAAPPLAFNQIIQVGTNSMAVGWPAVVGQQYQLQGNIDLGTTNWVNLGGIVNARLTNVVTTVAMTNSMQFYKLNQIP